MSNPPEVSLWLSLPDDCYLRAEFEVSDGDTPEIQIAVGGRSDDIHLLFERGALVRFVTLANRLLAIPDPGAALTEANIWESSYQQEIRVIPPRFA
jgi:hypothetical protein